MGVSKVELLEAKHHQPITEIVLQVIKEFNSWDERAKKLDISKNTLFSWCKQYLGKPPAILLRDINFKSKQGTMFRKTKLVERYPEIRIVFG